MQPTMLYPFNIRSFFTDRETKCSCFPLHPQSVLIPSRCTALGGGMVLWRGYFQSVRPAPGKMVINVDISTGLMFKVGSSHLVGYSDSFALALLAFAVQVGYMLTRHA
jgi:eukaryotic translation initiation factor 2C